MDNKFVWLIGGIVITYFFMKNKGKKEVMAKVDNAVATITNEIHQDFNAAISAAQANGLDLPQFQQLINSR